MPGPFYSCGQLSLVFGAGSIYPSGNNFSPFSKKVLKDFGILVVNYYLRIGTKAANLTSREDLLGFHNYLSSLIIRVAVVEAVNLLCFYSWKAASVSSSNSSSADSAAAGLSSAGGSG